MGPGPVTCRVRTACRAVNESEDYDTALPPQSRQLLMFGYHDQSVDRLSAFSLWVLPGSRRGGSRHIRRGLLLAGSYTDEHGQRASGTYATVRRSTAGSLSTRRESKKRLRLAAFGISLGASRTTISGWGLGKTSIVRLTLDSDPVSVPNHPRFHESLSQTIPDIDGLTLCRQSLPHGPAPNPRAVPAAQMPLFHV